MHKTTVSIFTAATGLLLVYLDTDSKFAAVITSPGLHSAHNADLGVGCHPYARATTWQPVSLLPTLVPAIIAEADEPIVADWCEWADDVFALYAEDQGKSLAECAQSTGNITDARFADEVNVALAREDLDIAVTTLDLDGIRAVTRFASAQSSVAALV